MMRLRIWICIAALLVGAGCGDSARTPSPPPAWQTAFWLWRSETPFRPQATPVDALFVQIGSVLPESLPPAREYWLVFRLETRSVPAPEVARDLARQIADRLMPAARRRGLPVKGIQIDLDSPTRQLPQYAAFLRELRKGIGPGLQISITALLDWFQPRTEIGQVIAEVDEFVPQFYDVADRLSRATSIAAPFDAGKWGPLLNRFGKRFRIGISTFGRSRPIAAPGAQSCCLGFGPEKPPIGFAANPAFRSQGTITPAKEVVLRYEAVRETKVGYSRVVAGSGVEFMLPTVESVSAAVGEARRMGGQCAGVVFFRWPGRNQQFTLNPDDVLSFALQPDARAHVALDVQDGACAAVFCADVVLRFPPLSSTAASSTAVVYSIRSSSPIEYFLPTRGSSARLATQSTVELTVPPFTGLGRMYLGRVVLASKSAPSFTLEETR